MMDMIVEQRRQQVVRHILADVLERVTQAHRGRGFTLTGGRGTHRGHEDHPRAFAYWLL